MNTLLLVPVLATLLTPVVSGDDVKLPAMFRSGMVLQRDIRVPIWGTANPGEQIKVEFAGKAAQVQANTQGNWRTLLGPFPAGGPFKMSITGKTEVVIDDVLVGEVWVCSGQSNMEWAVRRAKDPDQEIRAASFPKIRLFKVPRRASVTAVRDVDAKWTAVTPKTVADFSAVGYYFGRELFESIHVPIGLIQSAWGGTPVESWMSEQAIADKRFAPLRKRWEERAKKQPRHPHRPSNLFRGMINPLLPYGIRGVVWYQGESNASRAEQYVALFPALIEDWRGHWNQIDNKDFPFYFVQLANFTVRKGQDPRTWAELREAQSLALRLPNTGMAVTIDIGNPRDIHPRNKQEVGRRLALLARARVYGEDVEDSGPMFRRASPAGRAIRIEFDNSYGLRARGDGELLGFTIAGSDRKFLPAEARIVGRDVIVQSDEVPAPVAVRYAWTDNPTCNLVNHTGLPASPFRTDTWPRVTAGKH